ncbi:Uncharacterized protein OS=Bergeyella zoohelcum ATCC 43767 GN=HMPREF9699_01578 PE=4 SV=1 [Gemmata massiliana]|uniref:Uncharacterized protein n=1 Tax=Gemmata massiliana TaxID=1210884 RepID=A0A6P2DB26_9BACT|nr:hypothetical protein [Gemmata massiliana]VTR98169.1 Uncharacterized protein OS=Bergeyella zoohelcum ATCC 43767 GN=HMPREF9699_01578 PE=4 SV=1 [Gemmata massiliana]
MSLTECSELRDVHGISEDQKALIKAFIQGAVYCWVKNREGEPFAVRDLVGGVNANWSRTPLHALHTKHIKLDKDEESANEAAAKDLGWLVKTILHEDKRKFEAAKSGLVSTYRWIGGGS